MLGVDALYKNMNHMLIKFGSKIELHLKGKQYFILIVILIINSKNILIKRLRMYDFSAQTCKTETELNFWLNAYIIYHIYQNHAIARNFPE